MMKKRTISLDIIRSIAAIAVVIFHVLGASVNNDPLVSEHRKLIITSISETMQWHVPVFFILTGFIWLSDEKECTYRKMLPNIRRFILVLFTIGLAYAFMERIFSAHEFSLSLLFGSFTDVINGKLWDHMWYIYSIIGIYLFLPVIKPFFTQSSAKTITVFVSILFIFSVLSPALLEPFGYNIPIDFPSSSAVFYVCIGGLISKRKRYSVKTTFVSAFLFCLGICGIFIITRYFPHCNNYNSLLKSLCAINLFLFLFSVFSSAKTNHHVLTFAKCTFGIYLFHPFFINLMLKLLHINPARAYPIVFIPTACILIVFLSFLTTYILRLIPWVKKYIL